VLGLVLGLVLGQRVEMTLGEAAQVQVLSAF